MRDKAILGQIADVDIRLLRIFKAVARCGGFSAAELELNIGRSTISRHIKDLETRLGVSLCRRGRAGFALTEEGQLVYSASMKMLAALDEFRTEINQVHKKMTGTLAIALFDKTATNPDCRIYQAIERFDALAPQVKIEIYVEPLNDIEKGVMNGTFQIGVIPNHRPSASLEYHHLFNEPMHLYCGQRHPFFAQDNKKIRDQEILAARYAGLGYHSPNMERGRELGMTRQATAFDQEGIVTLILSGCYIGFLPDHYAGRFIEQGLIRAIGEKTFHYNCRFSAILRHDPKPNRISAVFLKQLLQVHGGHSAIHVSQKPQTSASIN